MVIRSGGCRSHQKFGRTTTLLSLSTRRFNPNSLRLQHKPKRALCAVLAAHAANIDVASGGLLNDLLRRRDARLRIAHLREHAVEPRRLLVTEPLLLLGLHFDYMSRREIIKVQKGAALPSLPIPGTKESGKDFEFEEVWTGGYIFENEWQSFRTRQNRELGLTTVLHVYEKPGRYTVAVKVIDIFGNDTMTLVPVNVG